MRRRRVVLERLDQHELVRVVDAPGSLEEDVARLAAGGLGEVLDEGEPLATPLRPDGPLDDDEDHGVSLGSGGGPRTVRAMRVSGPRTEAITGLRLVRRILQKRPARTGTAVARAACRRLPRGHVQELAGPLVCPVLEPGAISPVKEIVQKLLDDGEFAGAGERGPHVLRAAGGVYEQQLVFDPQAACCPVPRMPAGCSAAFTSTGSSGPVRPPAAPVRGCTRRRAGEAACVRVRFW